MERVFLVRNERHSRDPRQQQLELRRVDNARLNRGQFLHVFPLSNWTETDIWTYALWRGIELAPRYFTEPRRVIERDRALIVVDEPERMPLRPATVIRMETVRFRTLGCWPVTAATRSEVRDLPAVVCETLTASTSER